MDKNSPHPPDLVDRVRRVLAEQDGFTVDCLEPHDYRGHAAAVIALVFREAAELLKPEGFGYGGPDHVDAWDAAADVLRRRADEAESVPHVVADASEHVDDCGDERETAAANTQESPAWWVTCSAADAVKAVMTVGFQPNLAQALLADLNAKANVKDFYRLRLKGSASRFEFSREATDAIQRALLAAAKPGSPTEWLAILGADGLVPLRPERVDVGEGEVAAAFQVAVDPHCELPRAALDEIADVIRARLTFRGEGS